jgi:DNA-binding transcriptional regulator YhcF (GntR family)
MCGDKGAKQMLKVIIDLITLSVKGNKGKWVRAKELYSLPYSTKTISKALKFLVAYKFLKRKEKNKRVVFYKASRPLSQEAVEEIKSLLSQTQNSKRRAKMKRENNSKSFKQAKPNSDKALRQVSFQKLFSSHYNTNTVNNAYSQKESSSSSNSKGEQKRLLNFILSERVKKVKRTIEILEKAAAEFDEALAVPLSAAKMAEANLAAFESLFGKEGISALAVLFCLPIARGINNVGGFLYTYLVGRSDAFNYLVAKLLRYLQALREELRAEVREAAEAKEGVRETGETGEVKQGRQGQAVSYKPAEPAQIAAKTAKEVASKVKAQPIAAGPFRRETRYPTCFPRKLHQPKGGVKNSSPNRLTEILKRLGIKVKPEVVAFCLPENIVVNGLDIGLCFDSPLKAGVFSREIKPLLERKGYRCDVAVR